MSRYALVYPVLPDRAEFAAKVLAASEDPPLVAGTTKLLSTSVFRHGTDIVRVFEIDGSIDELIAGLSRAVEVADVGAKMATLFRGEYDFTSNAGLRGFFRDNLMVTLTDRNAETAAPGPVDADFGEVAVLGTGTMGHGIVERLATVGVRTRVWNRTPERARFDNDGVEAFGTPADAVRGADTVILVLSDDEAMTSVLVDGDRPLAQVLEPGRLVLNLGTVSAAAIRRAGTVLAARGISLLDVGMLGNSAHAASGELRLFAGGPHEEVERARPILERLGKSVRRVGDLGAGMNVKLVMNLLMGLEMQALAEVVALGEALGLSRPDLLDTVSTSGFAAPVMSFKAARMKEQRYTAPDFRLALMAKDLGLAAAAARAHGVPAGSTVSAHRAHAAAADAGWGEFDCAAIADGLSGASPGTVAPVSSER